MLTARLVTAVGLVIVAGCASAPPAPPPRIVLPYEQKVASMLRLEDHRVLEDARSRPVPPPPQLDRRGRPLPAAAPPAPTDLLTLLDDAEARVRRRAALAVGRVGLPAGVAPLTARLTDADGDVRAMAAFALGLIGDGSAVPALTLALGDPNPLVGGRAAHALGLIGPEKAGDAAAAIGAMVKTLVDAGALSTPPPDDEAQALSAEAEAIRRGLIALTALRSYDALADAVLDAQGRPRSSWWPIAFALSRITASPTPPAPGQSPAAPAGQAQPPVATPDPRAVPGLTALVPSPSPYTAAFAIRGLGERKAVASVPLLLPLLEAARAVHPQVQVTAVRAAGQMGGDREAAARLAVPLLALLAHAATSEPLALEIIAALGQLEARETENALLDRLTDASPFVRAAVLRALVRIDAITFTTVLSGLDPDRDWRVRAALADAVAMLPPENAAAMIGRLRADTDARVIPSVLRAWARLKLPGLENELRARLSSDDIVVRATAAALAGDQKATGLRDALVAAWQRGKSDSGDDARWAALRALATIDAEAARPHMEEALADREWPVRLRAARWLVGRDPQSDALARIRPAPVTLLVGAYDAPHLVSPAYSPQAYVETPRGTVQIQLAVLDAPLTVENFVSLARKGYFDGLQIHRVVPNFVVQDGDPRGDGAGGPGYSIRDELNDRSYGRGVVGMALAGADTGGSQWFITHSPQPHLDARYTVFGRVVNGMDVVDRLQAGDTITRIHIWDGVQP